MLSIFRTFIFCTAILLSSLTHAQVLERSDNNVMDYANVLSDSEIDTISDEIEEIRYSDHYEVVVVTISKIGRSISIDTFANTIFNQWKIGEHFSKRGVLILISIKDRESRIEVGKGFTGNHSKVMKKIILKDFNPHFRDGNIADGILLGLTHLTDAVERNLYVTNTSQVSQKYLALDDKADANTSNQSTSSSTVVIIIVAVILLVKWLFKRRSHRPRTVLGDDFFHNDNSYQPSRSEPGLGRMKSKRDDDDDDEYDKDYSYDDDYSYSYRIDHGTDNDYSDGDGASASWDD